MIETLVFVCLQFPEPGAVKPRLAEALGEDVAADVYTLLVEDTIDRLKSGAVEGLYRILLYTSPVNQLGRVALWLNDGRPPILEALPQPEGPLERRLQDAFHWGFTKLRARRVVLVGSDTPALDRSLIAKSLDLLLECDIVAAPSLDGGFSLLASTVNQPEVFSNVPWHTPNALEVLAGNATSLGLSMDITSLPALRVIETSEDLQATATADRERLVKRAAAKGFELPFSG